MPFSSPLLRSLLLWGARIAAILAASVLVTAALLPYDAWPDTHEDLRYQFLTALFSESLATGFWYPRWLPEMAGGYGYPTFIFYQPGFFYCAAGWMQLVGSPSAATYCTVLSFLCVGAIGAYLVGRELGDEWTGGFAAALLLLTPYLYVNLLVRGDLSELTAMLLVPWLLFFAVRIVRRIEASQSVSAGGGGLGLVLAAMVYCHPMVALLASGMLLVLAIALAVQRLPLRPLLVAVGQAGLVTAGLSIFYALPLVQMSKYVDFADAISGYYTPSDHVVYPLQYFQTGWGFGGSKAGLGDGMSFQLGLPHAAIAIAGLIAARHDRLSRSLMAAYLILVVGATPLFGWLWDVVFPLRVVQFPWRILSLTAALQAALAAGVHKWMPKEPQFKLAAYLLLIVMVVYWSMPQFIASQERNYGVDTWVRERQARQLAEMITFTGADEFRPRTAIGLRQQPPRGMRPIVESVGSRRIEPAAGHSPHRIAYQIAAGPPSEVIIHQAYLPGWHVELGGQTIPAAQLEEGLTADGRMSIVVESTGEQSLVAYYGGPPGGTARAVACVLLLGGFVAMALVERRLPPQPVDSTASEPPPARPKSKR